MIRYLRMDLIAACVAVVGLITLDWSVEMPTHPTTQMAQSTATVQAGSKLISSTQMVKKVRHPLMAMANLGLASWYGAVLNGHRTASGETFNKDMMTASHRTLPFGTMVRVVDVNSGRSVVVRITDRGVLDPGRIIDLSSAAANDLGILRLGIAKVRLEVLGRAARARAEPKDEAADTPMPPAAPVS